MMGSSERPIARHLRLVLSAVWATVSLSPPVAQAHERFVLHRLKVPLQNDFFTRSLMQNPDMSRIGVNVALVLLAFLVIWMFRFPLQEFVEERILGRFGGATQRVGHSIACFLTDSPVRHKLFHLAGEWAVIMLLRSPGLVLMYSATTDSLVMPSFPLDPGSATIFKFTQAGVAILIRYRWQAPSSSVPGFTCFAGAGMSPWMRSRFSSLRPFMSRLHGNPTSSLLSN
jgi:hypothetical protein